MKVVQPVAVTDAALIASTVPETDYPEWSGATSYALGARVIRAAAHRAYESAEAANLAHDPTEAGGPHWIDIGPTNRWAMFDQAVGSQTTAAGSVAVTVAPAALFDTVALVEIGAASARLQVTVAGATIYDRVLTTATAGSPHTTLVFADIPPRAGAQLVMTVTGPGVVSVGTLLIGSIADLGETEASPSIGLIDYSKRTTDDFGVTTVAVRSFAKTMTTRTKIDTAAADDLQRRVAALRATPALWIGEDGYDSLAVYGFWKSFSIDLVLVPFSYCSWSIEGLAA